MTTKFSIPKFLISLIIATGLLFTIGCDSDSDSNNGSELQAPSYLQAQLNGTTGVHLSWTDNSNNETGFTVERKLEGQSYEQIGIVNENTESYTVTGLTESTLYTFRVRAYLGSGHSDYSNEASITTGSSGGDTDIFADDIMVPWAGGPAYYSQWSNGPTDDPNFFPISVWLQSPDNAENYKAIGINQYIGLWDGPTEDQLSTMADNNISVICSQNDVGLTSDNSTVIKSFMHQDEPDNAQNGTQDPVPTADIISGYNEMVAQDSTRPVYLNLGQGVAADAWYGRGNRTHHPEDYAEYAKGADILSFDIYPMNVFPRPDSDPYWFTDFDNVVAQQPKYVAEGVDRLREWAEYQKPVWVWIECTNIHSHEDYALMPYHVKAEVWMAIIHGARGIGYFTHEFTSGGGYITDSGLLSNAEMKTAVTEINAQISELAPVLNTQSIANGVTTDSSNSEVPVDTMVKRYDGYTYLFAVAMLSDDTTATFTLREFRGNSTVEVIGENRSLTSDTGVFEDDFSGYDVHIYKIANP